MINPSEILKQRQFVSVAQKSPFWALLNLFSFFACIFEFQISYFSSFSSILIVRHVISIIEIFLVFLFFINFAYNLYIFIWFKRFLQPIELTREEFVLFGINENEIGFKVREEITANDSSSGQKNKFPLTPTFDISSSFIHSSLDSTALSTRLFNDSSLSQAVDVKSNSWIYNSPAKKNDTSLNKSSNDSFQKPNGLRFRKSRSFLNSWNNDSSGSGIMSKDDVHRLLQEHEQREEAFQESIESQKRFGTLPLTPNSNESILNSHSPLNHSNRPPKSFGDHLSLTVNRSDYSPKSVSFNDSFHNNNPFNDASKLINIPGTGNRPGSSTSSLPSLVSTYKPAIKISSQPSSPEKSESLNSSTRTVEKILAKLQVDDSRLNQMVENIRKWISQTILVRLVQEIDSINKIIMEKGYIDSLIGETSIKQLKYLAENKRSEFPTLEKVCPFLDIQNVRNIENNIPFQQYLVRRIKDLAKGGCMIEFLWDGGGSYNYRPWKEEMITDTEIVLHEFCVYMDARLLFNPTIPEGKPFTSQYFKPIKSDEPLKSDTYIQQDKAYPPHYSLTLKGEHFDIPPGRNNLFYTLLIFIHHIKVKHFGLLGRINLGPSGLNIAWVIEKPHK